MEDENILKAATTKTYALGRIIPQEIRNPISDARGYAYLPGTAIKGAIRTALGALKLKDEKGSWQHNKPFGGIQSDPLRNLQVTDVYFSENPGGLFGQKIYCANFSNEVGLWKTKAKGGHEEYFDQKKFTNFNPKKIHEPDFSINNRAQTTFPDQPESPPVQAMRR